MDELYDNHTYDDYTQVLNAENTEGELIMTSLNAMLLRFKDLLKEWNKVWATSKMDDDTAKRRYIKLN